jgi:hypothetical protein
MKIYHKGTTAQRKFNKSLCHWERTDLILGLSEFAYLTLCLRAFVVKTFLGVKL